MLESREVKILKEIASRSLRNSFGGIFREAIIEYSQWFPITFTCSLLVEVSHQSSFQIIFHSQMVE